MHDMKKIEQYFNKFTKNLNFWLPEDIFEIDEEVIKKMHLENYEDIEEVDPKFTQYFHVVEAMDKITLINEEFVVWIVPEIDETTSRTYTIIARNQKKLHLELAFITSGIRNNSKLILRVLEKLLYDIRESQNFLDQLAAE